jgi:hypothetical protein
MLPRANLLTPQRTSEKDHLIQNFSELGSEKMVGSRAVMSAYSAIAEQLAQIGKDFAGKKSTNTCKIQDVFSGTNVPKISIENYVERICQFTNSSDSTLVMSLIYIDRLIDSQKGLFQVHAFNIHRLILVSTMTAAKFAEDKNFKNSYWCQVGGVSKDELNYMEKIFLFSIKFELHADQELFEQYQRFLNPPQTVIEVTDEEECVQERFEVRSSSNGHQSVASPSSTDSDIDSVDTMSPSSEDGTIIPGKKNAITRINHQTIKVCS